jgi:vancomycin resistance protein YoaR
MHRLLLLLSLGLVGLSASGAAAALYIKTVRAPVTLRGLSLLGQPLSEVSYRELPARVRAIVQAHLQKRVRLRVGSDTVRARLADLGLSIDEAALVEAAQRSGRSGDPLADVAARLRARRHGLALRAPIALNEERALEFLAELKDQVDRSPTDARLDLERHTIAPERPGYLLRVYDSLVALSYAARALAQGQEVEEIDLHVATTQPTVRAADLRGIDVSTVLGSWETRYSTSAIDSDRTYNLKVGADKLNGHILKPGEVFSFNAVVGDRTEKEGYRVAPVIQGGELIDGLAGGMCQIASTLHAAAFFAGVEIVRATPHSRPSTYIPMGLDSTVVYPSVDLKLKNPYDFPLVLHYQVNQGSVKVEILGKARPYHVAFEREVLVETPFGTQVRTDPEMPSTQKVIDQDGYPGYRIKRRRYIYTGKWRLDRRHENRPDPEGLISKKEWDIVYPATTQIVRQGTGPAKLKPKEPPPSHRIPPVPERDKPLFYIVR